MTRIWNKVRPVFAAIVAASSVLVAFTPSAHAGSDCVPAWQPQGEAADTNGNILAFAQLPNGDILAGGSFTRIGGVDANYIARWDGEAWSPVGGGMSFRVTSLAVTPGGDVIAGGGFQYAGGTSEETGGVFARYVARWNGSTWSPLDVNTPAPFPVSVSAVAAMPNGDVIVCSLYEFGPADNAGYIAKWDGTTWSSLGSGLNGAVNALAFSGGQLIAAGAFTQADGAPANRIARWNGSAWSSFGNGFQITVRGLAIMPNGDVVAGGQFTVADGNAVPANRVARWNGSAWEALGAGVDGTVTALTVLNNGDLVVGGHFLNAGGMPASGIARWDGSNWFPLGTGVNVASPFTAPIAALKTDVNGSLLVGGDFTTAGGVSSPYLAVWGCPVAPACSADFNQTNGVTVQDIFDFLTAWLAGSSTADFNTVNGVTVQDIFDFLTAWLAGC